MMKLRKLIRALLALSLALAALPLSAAAATKNPGSNMDFVHFSEDGTPILTFPMEYLKVTQPAGVGTHVGTDAFDVAGKDSGADGFYAPVDLVVKRVYHAKSDLCNALFLESKGKVLLANGKVSKVTLMLIHVSNKDLAKYKAGQKIAAGSLICLESDHGYATGNHLHVEVSDKPYSGWAKVKGVKSKVDIWALNDTIAADEAFFVDRRVTTVLKENGYHFAPILDLEQSDVSLLLKANRKCSALAWPEAGAAAVRSCKKGALVYATASALNRESGEQYYRVDGAWIKADNLTLCEEDSGGVLWANQKVPAGSYRLVNQASRRTMQYNTSKKTVSMGDGSGKNTVFTLSAAQGCDVLSPKDSKVVLNAASDTPSENTKMNLYKKLAADTTQQFVLQSVSLFEKKCILRLAYNPSLCVTEKNGKLLLTPYSGEASQIWELAAA
ncbi:MAG: hypothetical protein IJC43_06755 [Clostridia bacterium]|nr:hypothetical protein [Clostridia bacterium]